MNEESKIIFKKVFLKINNLNKTKNKNKTIESKHKIENGKIEY